MHGCSSHTSSSLLAMLKWEDFTMLQTSRLFSVVPGIVQYMKNMIHAHMLFSNKFFIISLKALTLKLDVSQVQESSEQLEDFPGVILREHENLQSRTKLGIFHHVISALTAGAFALAIIWLKKNKKKTHKS